MKVTHIAGLVLIASLFGLPSSSMAETRSPVDSRGNLHVPVDYRTLYRYLGTWAVADGKRPRLKQLHVVYSSPGTQETYRNSGHFADGSILVKEVFAATTGHYTTGTVSHAQTLVGWFVMVKDTKHLHPENKLWGDGWAWSWFDANNPRRTTSTNYKTDCQMCHVPARGSDWIYVTGYPVLRGR